MMLFKKERNEKPLDGVHLERALVRVLSEGKKETFYEILAEIDSYTVATQYKELPRKRKSLFLEWLSIKQLTNLLKYLTKTIS